MSAMREAVLDLLTPGDRPVREAVDRHVAPGFRQRVDGAELDREAFVARMTALRASVARVAFTVLDEVQDGSRYAERHRIELVLTDGTRVRREVLVFAERDARGRFVRIDEAGFAVPDDPPRDASATSGP
jgi:hypothetical protein